jgi:hypothetical protein
MIDSGIRGYYLKISEDEMVELLTEGIYEVSH